MKRGSDAPHSAINVTPLVDVCLVLLIIFMVVAPMLDPRDKVKLPEAAKPETIPHQPKPAELQVRADGSLWLGNRWLPEPDAEAALRELHARAAGTPIVVYGDRDLRFADVRRAMKLAHAAGFAGVSLAARKEAAAAR